MYWSSEPRQRTGGEVRAVLVVDVPERPLAQHAQDVRDLKEDARLRPVLERAPQRPYEQRDIAHVFERVTADDRIGLEEPGPPRVELRDDRHTLGARPGQTAGDGGRIDPHAMVSAELTELGEEVSLAAADLDDPLVAQPPALDQTLRQLVGERREAGRVALLLLVRRVVGDERGNEAHVVDEAAALAHPELQVAGRDAQRILTAGEDARVVHRDPERSPERLQTPVPAGAAPHVAGQKLRGELAGRPHATTCTAGIGMMKRPPRSWKSCS
jgi:hypothetical protein